jgi:hypothetical protein
MGAHKDLHLFLKAGFPGALFGAAIHRPPLLIMVKNA